MLQRRTLHRAGAYWTAVLVALLALWTSGAPSTTYPLYERVWQLQPLTITEVFGLYPLALVVVLLFAGNVSDHVGRRPTMLLGVGGMLAGTIAFALATDVVWLFSGRILMGIGVGLALAPASASVVEHSKPGRTGAAAAVTTAATAAGVVLSVLIGGALVQYGPAPLKLDYGVLAFVLAVALILTAFLPSEEPPNRDQRWRPKVDIGSAPGQGRPLLAASFAAAVAYMTGGIFLALGASIARTITGTTNSLLVGALLAVPFVMVALLGLVVRRVHPVRAIRVGAAAAVVAFALLAITAQLGSVIWFVAAAVSAGVTYGFAFAGGLGYISVHYPAAHRAAALGVMYLIAYAGQGAVAVFIGVIATSAGLAAAVGVGSAVMVAMAVATLLLARRMRHDLDTER